MNNIRIKPLFYVTLCYGEGLICIEFDFFPMEPTPKKMKEPFVKSKKDFLGMDTVSAYFMYLTTTY